MHPLDFVGLSPGLASKLAGNLNYSSGAWWSLGPDSSHTAWRANGGSARTWLRIGQTLSPYRFPCISDPVARLRLSFRQSATRSSFLARVQRVVRMLDEHSSSSRSLPVSWDVPVWATSLVSIKMPCRCLTKRQGNGKASSVDASEVNEFTGCIPALASRGTLRPSVSVWQQTSMQNNARSEVDDGTIRASQLPSRVPQ